MHVLLDISAPRTRIKVLFAALKPCCKASRFEYNKPKFEDNLFLALRGARVFFGAGRGRFSAPVGEDFRKKMQKVTINQFLKYVFTLF